MRLRSALGLLAWAWAAGALVACTHGPRATSAQATPAPPSSTATSPRWEPKKTYAVIAGVLSWKDPALASFPTEERKDQELYDVLGARGVPGPNRVLLLDEAATAAAVREAVVRLASRAEPGSTFLFYFAGHGTKTNDDRIVFTTSDTDTSQLETSGLHLDALAPMLKGKLAGSRAVFLADCCYAGGLVDVAKTVSAGGVPSVALTSSESTNTSTESWIFTQTVIDALRGRPLSDRDCDGAVTLNELAAETRAAMKYREGQRYALASFGVDGALVLADAQRCSPATKPEPERPLGRGSYVLAPQGNAKTPARILAVDDAKGELSVGFYEYSHETVATVRKDAVKPIVHKSYAPGAQLDVVWGKETYEAKVLKVEDGFHFITYPGWPATWDEWVTDARIVGPHGAAKTQRRVSVLWHGTWWAAVLLREEGGTYCIHYAGYEDSWDECVTRDRIRF
jgi:hypothetical protein